MEISFTEANQIKQFAVLATRCSQLRLLDHESPVPGQLLRQYAFTVLMTEVEHPDALVLTLENAAIVVVSCGMNEGVEPCLQVSYKEDGKLQSARIFYNVVTGKLVSEWTEGILF